MVYLAASIAPPPSTAGAGGQSGRPVRLEERWNWPAESTVAVTAYSNAEDVTLTLNGQPIGTRPMTSAVDGALRWDIPYQPGVLTAVARTKGQTVADFTLTTATQITTTHAPYGYIYAGVMFTGTAIPTALSFATTWTRAGAPPTSDRRPDT